MKPLLLTMTQSREEDIRKMISNIYPTFGGIVALVNQPCTDKTQEILEANKGCGKIITQNWTPHHGFLMNHLLFYGEIEENQWCLYLDSPESCTDNFISAIPALIDSFQRENISALYWDNRPYLFQFSEYLEVHNAVHWGISGWEHKIITSPDKDKYIINRRLDNKSISWCYNGSKYWVCYPLGNEVQSTYYKYGQEEVNKQEKLRQSFRLYLKKNLKLNLNTLDDLIKYMKMVENKEVKPDDYFIDVVDRNFRLSELYQLKVLNMDFMEQIAKKRHSWSFKAHLLNGNGWVEGYLGEINVLNKQFGYSLE